MRFKIGDELYTNSIVYDTNLYAKIFFYKLTMHACACIVFYNVVLSITRYNQYTTLCE
jgi:hypothetical protein